MKNALFLLLMVLVLSPFALCEETIIEQDEVFTTNSLIDAIDRDMPFKLKIENENEPEPFNTVQISPAEQYLLDNINMQKHINAIGQKLLNANKIDKRMIFVYHSGNSKFSLSEGLVKRQIYIYDDTVQYTQDDNEIAAFLARQISKMEESYAGMGRGMLVSLQIKCAPKKYELVFDKRAVDFMVTAGYNPIALITFMNKSEPQRRYDRISNHNLLSKRLAMIYEYIYTKYPYFIKNNDYLFNESYQNFLLTSKENRKKFYEKIKSGSKGKVDYE
ncbi:hypothetical protein II906_06825 [bacterium]|nr:hypothetical protein [bacterium]